MTMLKVGVSALFNPADTPHARTFLRAMCVARNFIPALAQVQWHFLDDGANRVRAEQVAEQMMAADVDLVIGHFSSDAAVSAAPVYRQAGIPLLTPAATIDCLTQDHHNVFRFCPSDRQLARDLLGWIAVKGWQTVHISADHSAHGQALAKGISRTARDYGIHQTDEREQAQVEVFAGRLRSSREHWQRRRAQGSQRPLILTDDAASPYLGNAAADDCNTWVIGFGNAETEAQPCPGTLQYTALFGTAAETAPETYYRESLLLFHVLGVLASRNSRRAELLHALNHTTFNTPMGEVSFDQGERRGAFNTLWRIGPQGLQPISE
ncbi:ABC transporter substrate-binding protein [Pseudomonas syringae]|nr:ABC transporter substrate-binding protein [Pseudomonas syringae]